MPSDATAKSEGKLLISNQALFRASEGSFITVQRDEPRGLLGRWNWLGAQAVWVNA